MTATKRKQFLLGLLFGLLFGLLLGLAATGESLRPRFLTAARVSSSSSYPKRLPQISLLLRCHRGAYRLQWKPTR